MIAAAAAACCNIILHVLELEAGHAATRGRRQDMMAANIITRAETTWPDEGCRTGGRTAAKSSGELRKILHRKPPVPTATAAHSGVGGANAKSASSSRYTGRGGGKSRKSGKKGAERGGEGRLPLDSEEDVSDTKGERDALYGPGRAQLVLHLRKAKEKIESLHRDQAAAAQERVHWQRRDDDLSRAVSELENSRQALERRLRAESDAVEAEKGRAKGAEARFERLLAWARVQEDRRRKAEDGLRSACEGTQAAKARAAVLEEEARECTRQLDVRRFRLEGALEDLRRRTLENERLEAQATTMRGEGEALRELADARGLESTDLREKLARLVHEAKCMSSENVNLRKQLSSEQERWRAAERSRAKHDERRRIEMERKSDDVHGLRYRVQELEARLSSETARRQGAEEDARRSQEMERRSMEELMEGRKSVQPVQAGPSHSLPHRATTNLFRCVPEPAPEVAWKSWGDGIRDTATAVGSSSSARSSSVSETFPANQPRRGPPSLHVEQRRQDMPMRRDHLAVVEDFATPTTLFPPPPFLPPSAAFSKGKPTTAATPVAAWQPIQPQPLSRSPVRVGVRRQDRPRPRQAPREGDDGDVGSLEHADGSGRDMERCVGSDERQGGWVGSVGDNSSAAGACTNGDDLRTGEERINDAVA